MSFGKHAPWFGIFLIPLLAILSTTCGPADDSARDSAKAAPQGSGLPSAPNVVISPNREMVVGGKSYRANDTHRPTDVEWAPGVKPDRRGLDVRPEGVPGGVVSMKAAGLKTIYIGEAARDSDTIAIVSGSYTAVSLGNSMNAASIVPVRPVVAKTWVCIWCGGEEILVCGVSPQCGPAGDTLP